MHNPSKLLSSWMTMEALHALYLCGILDKLAEATIPISVADLASRDIDHKNLEAMLVMVSTTAPDIISRTADGTYYVGDTYRRRHFQNTLHFSLAYQPVIHTLRELLSQEKVYGIDVIRNLDALGRSSELYTTDIAHDIALLLKDEKPETIVDLGCGSGHMLQMIGSELSVDGIGIDANRDKPETFPSAYCYLYGDITQPESWLSNIPRTKKLILLASMVLHEFLYNGTDQLNEILKQYRKCFPGAVWYIAEYNGFTADELKNLPDEFKESAVSYQFVHPLTNQGMPQDADAWRKTFAQCGARVLAEYVSKPNATIYKVRL